jgi:RNA recognition motif-containing protein
MNTRIYVGNLNYGTTQESLQGVFAAYGEVTSCRLISDRETGKFRGFAFVEMSTEDAAQSAIKALDGQEVDGRQLRVNLAQDKRQDGPRGGGGYRNDRPRRDEY